MRASPRWAPKGRFILFAVVALLSTVLASPPAVAGHWVGTTRLQRSPAPAVASSVVHFRRLARADALAAAPVNEAKGIAAPGPGPGPSPAATGGSEPAVRAPMSAPRAIAPSQPVASNYAGLDDIAGLTSGFHYIPPDTEGAVGLTKVMESLNNNYRVRDKATGATLSTVSPESMWTGLGGTGFFDPRTQYDPYNNRWIVAMVSDSSTANSSIELGVSKTSDPEGAYWTFRIDADSSNKNWADFPTMGFNKNWIAININLFRNSNNFYQSSKVLVVNYPQLLTGVYSGSFFTGTNFSMHPAITDSSAQNTLYAVDATFGGTTYTLSTVTGTPASPVVTVGSVASRGVSYQEPSGNIEPQAPPSAGTSSCGSTPCGVDSGDTRIGAPPVFRNGNLYYAQTVGLPASGSVTHTGVLWTELSASTGNVVDGGTIQDASATSSNGGKWYAFPSVAVNADNDLLVGFTQFSSAQWPSAGYTMHLGTDAAGTMRDPVIYKAGEDYYHKDFGSGQNRWGDYSAAQVDPSNDTDLWTLQEYAKARVGTDDGTTGSNSSRWGTWWAKVRPHLPAISWDPAAAGTRVTNRPLTCNTPLGTCTDSGRSWTTGAPAVAVSNNGTTHYVHAVWTTDAPTGDESNGTVDHTSACASATNPATGSPPYCSGVYYARSSNGGGTWNGGGAGTAPFAVSQTNTHAGRAAIATSGNWVYVAYVTTVGYADKMCVTDPRVLWIRANNNYGAPGAWLSPVQLSSGTGHVDFPVVSANGSNVYVIHTDEDSGNVVFDQSSNNASSFSTKTIGHTQATYRNGVSPGSPTCSGAPTPSDLEGYSGRATVSGDGTTLGAAWVSRDTGKAVAKISTDGGGTWPGGANGSACTGVGPGLCTMHLTASGALGPGARSLVTSSWAPGLVAFSWVNDSGATLPKGLYVRTFTSAGGWGPARLISCMQTTGSCAGAPAAARYNDGYAPSIATYGANGLGVAWSGCPYTPTAPVVPCDQTPSGGNQDPGAEILWKESWDGGATWSAGEGPTSGYRTIDGDAGPSSTINDHASVAFDTTSGSGSGCAQQPRSYPVGIPELGCNRYVLFTGQTYGGTTTRLNLSIGTQVPG